jgi:hypothetical protein
MSLLSPAPTSRERPMALRFLDMHLRCGGFEQHSYDMLCNMVQIMARISHLLFPHSHVFREDVKQQAISLSTYIEQTCAVFGEHLVLRCNRASDAMDSLPDLANVDLDEFYERMYEWKETLQYVNRPDVFSVKPS